ncbi:MAG: hypothetical protein DM484_26620 [Candidatus Methylumidiphilus alinenensis]|uniref:Uncharacterized protein n=1 Tax=Candidatus Methylumidiphilus alinenensis TaxID=2202197 RepID=A0A2W4S6H6_9GAMM|nr:MAG: hypothetical protein DM484_26620 [Candidatus Methylumidiphilus alinenensis]
MKVKEVNAMKKMITGPVLPVKEPTENIGDFVCINSWAGRTEKPCRIVGETPTRFKIEVDVETWLPNGWLQPGQQRLVPKTSVRRIHESS